jgi:hypothetical protein
MASIKHCNNLPTTLTITVVLLSLSFCVIAQPILNSNDNNGNDESQEDVVAVETITIVRNENHRNKAGSAALIQLVVDNDEARKKWYQRRQQSLHDSLNGANGHFVKGKDNNEADASAIPLQESAPVATPEQLLALLEKKKGSVSSKSQHVRVIRQVPNLQYPVAPTVGGYPSPYIYQPQPNVYSSTAPPTTEAPTTTTSKPEAPSVEENIQSARDEYRKNRFAGSFYALALQLSKAGNTPLSEGGSYSG